MQRATSLIRSVLIGVMLFVPIAKGDTARPADAAATDDWSRPGLYVALGLVLGVDDYQWLDDLDALARSQPPVLGQPVVRSYTATNLLGVNLVVGKRLDPWFAVDGSFEWARADLLGDVSRQSTPTTRSRFTARVATLETWILTLNGRFYLLTGRIQPYALAGLGAIGATPIDRNGQQRDRTGFASRLGGGIDFYLTRQVVLATALSYVFATGDTSESSMLDFTGSFAFRY